MTPLFSYFFINVRLLPLIVFNLISFPLNHGCTSDMYALLALWMDVKAVMLQISMASNFDGQGIWGMTLHPKYRCVRSAAN